MRHEPGDGWRKSVSFAFFVFVYIVLITCVICFFRGFNCLCFCRYFETHLVMKVRDIKSCLRVNKGPAVNEVTLRFMQRLVPPMNPPANEPSSNVVSSKVSFSFLLGLKLKGCWFIYCCSFKGSV